MSLSINPYSKHYAYVTTRSESDVANANANTVTSSADARDQASDSVELSREALEYMAGYQNYEPATTGTYGNNSGDESLSIDQKKLMISNLQNRLSTQSSSQTEAESSTVNPLTTLQEELADFDASSATDEEIGDLFDEVMQTLKSMRPPKPEGEGFPPMGEGMMPPPPPPPPVDGTEESQETDEQTLTTEQMKALLTDLQSKLENFGSSRASESESTSTDADTLLAALKEKIGAFDASIAADEEISEQFDDIMETLEQLRPKSNQ